MLAMDFTLHNGHYKNRQSLHYMPETQQNYTIDASGNMITKSATNQINVENLERGNAKTTTRVEQMIKK